MPVMGMNGNGPLEAMRGDFVKTSLVSAVLGPLVHLLLAACTREFQKDDPRPHPGRINTAAAHR